MDCKKAQRLFDDLSRNRLTEPDATEVCQHLTDCTDCRVIEQRSAKLQRLLALKRYERPTPDYFDNFLTDFHTRLAEQRQEPDSLWLRAVIRFEEFISAEPVRVWRYGFASALSLAVAVGAIWVTMRQTGDVPSTADQTVAALNPPVIMAEAMLSGARSTPKVIAANLPNLPRDAQDRMDSAPASSVVLIPTATHAESPAPRYVLDRIALTPASYEVASVHF